MKVDFILTIDVPNSWTINQIKQQVLMDIGSWAGSLPDTDKINDLNRASISINTLTKKRLLKLNASSCFG